MGLRGSPTAQFRLPKASIRTDFTACRPGFRAAIHSLELSSHSMPNMPRRDRIESPLVQRMASQQPQKRHPSAAQPAPLRNGNRGILRARRLKTATARSQRVQRGGNRAAIKKQQSPRQLFPQLHRPAPSAVFVSTAPAGFRSILCLATRSAMRANTVPTSASRTPKFIVVTLFLG